MNHKPSRFLLVIIICISLTGAMTYTLYSEIAEIPPVENITLATINFDAEQIDTMLSVITEKSGRQAVIPAEIKDPFQIPEAIVTVVPEIKIDPPSFKLKGIMLDGSRDLAIIELATGSVVFLKPGEAADSYTLESLTKTEAFFTKSGTGFVLTTQ